MLYRSVINHKTARKTFVLLSVIHSVDLSNGELCTGKQLQEIWTKIQGAVVNVLTIIKKKKISCQIVH